MNWHKPTYYLFVTSCFLLLFLLFVGGGVLAEGAATVTTSPISAAKGLPEDTIFLKRFSSAESQRLVRLYQDQYEKYRQTEREFITAQAQYAKLKTLAALESAVVSSRKIMLDRSDILITYQELLAATLVESTGVELQLKQETLKQIQEAIDSLKTTRKNIADSNDRYAIASVNNTFETKLVPRLYSVAYKTLSQLVVADIQSLFDKTKQVYKDVQVELSTKQVSKLKLEERKRAYTEVDAAISELEQQLAAITTQVRVAKVFDGNFYKRLVDELQVTYGKLGRLITYVEELERTIHE